jgi:hypothetical protein
MAFDAEKEISRLWASLHSAQDEIGRTYYRWRQAALKMAGPNAKSLDVSLKAAEIFGMEIGKSFLPRLNWLKGEEFWLMSLANSYAGQWINHGAIVKVEKGSHPFEALIQWERCPWPTFAKEYGVPMEEDVLCCDKILQTILGDVNVFFNVNYKIETLKAIPRGEGVCLRKLYKV